MKRKYELEFDTNQPLENEFLAREELKPDDVKQILMLGFALFKTGANELFRGVVDMEIKEREFALRQGYEEQMEKLRTETQRQIDTMREDIEKRYLTEIASWELKLAHTEEGKKEYMERYKLLDQEIRNTTLTAFQQSMDEVKALIDKKELRKFEERVDQLRCDVEKQFQSEIRSWQWKCTQLEEEKKEHQQRYKGLEEKLEGMHQSMYAESVLHLKEKLHEKEVEIRVLKNSNAVKGTIGEGLIQSALRTKYHDAEVVDMSHISHVCDIHMTLTNGKKIVFESKYKQTIDRKDIQKFYTDMKDMSDEVMGGIFVSVLSKNIPGKGSIAVEHLSDNHKMVLFLGFHDEQDFHTFFLPYVDMFLNICHFHTRKVNTALNIQHVLDEINFYYQLIQKNRIKMDDFKGKFHKFMTELEADHKDIMSRIETMLQKHHYQPSISGVGCSSAKKAVYACELCTQTFSNKKVLQKHIKDTHG